MESNCSIEGCIRPYSRGGYCNAHYLRIHRTGSSRLRYSCKVDGCDSELFGSQRICSFHSSQCVLTACQEPRAGRSVHCKRHKNHRGIPLPAPAGMVTCRRCRHPLPSASFYAGHDWCKGCHQAYRATNRGRMQAWRAANRDRVLAYNRTYEPRMRELQKARSTTIRKRTVPFATAQLEQRFAYYGYRCWICRGPGEHADHVKPISAGGWHMLANLRPACARCNRRKNKTWPLTAIDMERIRAT